MSPGETENICDPHLGLWLKKNVPSAEMLLGQAQLKGSCRLCGRCR